MAVGQCPDAAEEGQCDWGGHVRLLGRAALSGAGACAVSRRSRRPRTALLTEVRCGVCPVGPPERSSEELGIRASGLTATGINGGEVSPVGHFGRVANRREPTAWTMGLKFSYIHIVGHLKAHPPASCGLGALRRRKDGSCELGAAG